MKARCVADAGMPSLLTIGKVYEVTDVGRSPVHNLPLVEVVCDKGTTQRFYASRFESVAEAKKTGTRALKCRLSPGSCSGQVNVPPSGTVCGEPVDCPYKEKSASASDLDQLKAILTKGGANVRTWRIGSYIDRDGNIVRADGWVLVHGSENDDGPYTQYLFDAAGALLPNGVSTICFDNGVLKEA